MTRTPQTMLLAGAAIVGLGLTLAGCAVGDAPGGGTTAGSDYPSKPLSILAPGSTGGGWDTRARAIQSGLADCGITDQSVSVTNTPGAGGTIGLADFVGRKGDSSQLMVMDTVTMLGGIIRNDSPYDLEDLTPVAALTVARTAVVVPAGSPIGSMDDLRTALVDDPTSVSWAGGSLGGPDHLMAALLATRDGIDVSKLNYVATGGGGEVVSLLLSGSASVATSTLTELRAQIDAGALRVLAVTGDTPVDGIDAPTLGELGLADIDTASTGGVLAPPGVSKAEASAAEAMFERFAGSACWKKSLAANNWDDAYADGKSFAKTIKEDKAKVQGVLADLGLAG